MTEATVSRRPTNADDLQVLLFSRGARPVEAIGACAMNPHRCDVETGIARTTASAVLGSQAAWSMAIGQTKTRIFSLAAPSREAANGDCPDTSASIGRVEHISAGHMAFLHHVA